MKFIRIRSSWRQPTHRPARYFVQPNGWWLRLVLLCRGWRPANLPNTPLKWWIKPGLPRAWGTLDLHKQ